MTIIDVGASYTFPEEDARTRLNKLFDQYDAAKGITHEWTSPHQAHLVGRGLTATVTMTPMTVAVSLKPAWFLMPFKKKITKQVSAALADAGFSVNYPAVEVKK